MSAANEPAERSGATGPRERRRWGARGGGAPRMSFEWFVARRYLVARRKQAFISLISGVSILGVGVGVMALIIALALMSGVQSELQDRIVGSTAHVYIYKMTE